MPGTSDNVRIVAAVGAEERQRVLNEVCRRALQGFYGRKLTPTLMAEAEATMRAALDDAVRAGLYVLPDGLELDRVVLGTDMRIKVLFRRAAIPVPTDAFIDLRGGAPAEPATETVEDKMRSRFEAVAAEINSKEDA